MPTKTKSRLIWFVAVFLIFMIGGMITFYLAGIELKGNAILFLLVVALLTGLGSALTGPNFEEIIRQRRRQ